MTQAIGAAGPGRLPEAGRAADAGRVAEARYWARWAPGDHLPVASDLIGDLGAVLVEACGVRPGDRVLDVAAGSGNAAIPAALAGADVVACDVTPHLLDAGRQRAVLHGVEVEWHQAAAEALPFADDQFDVVLSCVGVMFAADHQASADEMLRVCRPGATIGLLNWTPDGFVGHLFATTVLHGPPPPLDAQPPPLWGHPEYVRTLLADRVTGVTARRQAVRVDRFASPEAFRDRARAADGPTAAAYRSLAGQPERVAALDRDLVDLARRHDRGGTTTVMEWEYLLLTARKRF